MEPPVREPQSPAGLASISDVEALADQISASANALHKRIMKEIKAQQGPFSDEQQAALRALCDDEQLLRQHADALYGDAAAAVAPSLRVPQQRIMALTNAAIEKIRRIDELGELIGLTGGLAALAGSALKGNVAGIVDAVEVVHTQLAGVIAHRPKPPPKP